LRLIAIEQKDRTIVAKKSNKIVIKKEALRPKERAPILPSKPIADRREKEERREKHKKDLRRTLDSE
jgi:hypothetical protein